MDAKLPHTPPTIRLDHDDSLRLRFEGTVIAHAAWNGAPSIVLDRSAFYPESGGQMADRGQLGTLAVSDVQIDDAGVVHHVIAAGADLPAIGATLAGEIDQARRRTHMALHTGQHMLSRALVDVARGETVSSRLGETACTIDIDRAELPDAELARCEDLVNAIIDDDVTVRAYFPDPAELASLPLRRKPKVTEHVRVVQIGEFDVSPCGGTHCTRSAQVGFVRVTGVERYKGKIRVTFASGARARRELGAEAAILRAMAQELTCGPAEVRVAVDKLRRELTDTRMALGITRGRLAEAAAPGLVADAKARGATQVVAVFDDADVDFLRAVAKRVIAEPGFVALLAARGAEGTHVLVTRAPDATFDCGAFLKRVAQATGGRGGGTKERAEGRLPRDVDWAALAAT
jgi:alanyl-tRNA synthetase